MSFLEILRAAREKTNKDIQKSIEVEEIEHQEPVEQNKVVKNDVISHTYIGDAIINTAKDALIKSKNFKTVNAAVRLSKKLASGNITKSDLDKCFKMQKRFPKETNWNYQLVGGDSLKHLRYLLAAGVDLNTALNRKIER